MVSSIIGSEHSDCHRRKEAEACKGVSRKSFTRLLRQSKPALVYVSQSAPAVEPFTRPSFVTIINLSGPFRNLVAEILAVIDLAEDRAHRPVVDQIQEVVVRVGHI